MFNYDVHLTVEYKQLPLAYRHYLDAKEEDSKDPEPYHPNEAVEIDLEVRCEGGHYAPANLSGHPDTWHPDESEDPDIISVVIEDGKESFDWPVRELGEEIYGRLVRAAWDARDDHQKYAWVD